MIGVGRMTVGDVLLNKVGSTPAKKEKRHLHAIAREIKQKWTKPYFGAVPYINAMLTMHSADEDYGADSGKSIVLYFLANANTWRGEDARRIKAELKALVK